MIDVGQSMVFVPLFGGIHFSFQRIYDKVKDGLDLSVKGC